MAQWIRHRPPKPRIVGSSPTVGKLFSSKCERKQQKFCHANLKIQLSELHNYTFTNDPPFDVLGIPECGQQVENQIKTFFPSFVIGGGKKSVGPQTTNNT